MARWIGASLSRLMSPQLVVTGGILCQNLASVRFAEDNGRRTRWIDPISLLAKPFCHGEPGAMGLSRMPWPVAIGLRRTQHECR
jgi:hypothetical protein